MAKRKVPAAFAENTARMKAGKPLRKGPAKAGKPAK
jgi:hypothetical protein